jgi:hypothetical protein
MVAEATAWSQKKEKNMSATGIEPMTNHLGDRNVTIVLLGC